MKLIFPSLIACLFTSDLVVAQSSEKDLVGVWEVKVTPRDAPGTFLGIDMFSADGNFIHNVMRRFRLFRRFNPSGQSAVPVAADGSERAKKISR
jgi:hypothetical protein